MLVFLLVLGVLAELILASKRPLKGQKLLAGSAIIIITLVNAVLILTQFKPITVLIITIHVYRIFNLLRVVEGRMHDEHLLRTVARTSCALVFFEVCAAVLWFLSVRMDIGGRQVLFGLIIVQLFTALILLLSTGRNLFKTRFRAPDKHFSDSELPTVTVAIPARNETADLAACLESIVANDYPKLEIVVLDDCSADRTAEVIRDFAQAGVRFIPGEAPRDRWLGKNQAYAELAKEAAGSHILFCGVDVRLGNQAIRTLVTMLLSKQKQMVSVLPKRCGGNASDAFIQPMRYWWEVALPRRLFSRPPVLSSCWLIHKEALRQAGGFEAVSHSIVPEAYFARQLLAEDGYSFMRSSEQLDIQTTKKLGEQYQTGLRVSYPQLRRRPENVLLVSLGQLLMLFAPFVVAIAGLWVNFGSEWQIAVISSLILVGIHSAIITVTNPSNWWVGLVNFPVDVLVDVVLKNSSMWKYEFSVVEWKGRNVCLPVLRNISHLPQ